MRTISKRFRVWGGADTLQKVFDWGLGLAVWDLGLGRFVNLEGSSGGLYVLWFANGGSRC
jgi:hypothetical protein